MTVANMNLIGVFVTKLWPVQALACGGGDSGGGDGATNNIISPKFSNFGDIIIGIGNHNIRNFLCMVSIHIYYKIVKHINTL